MIRQRFGGGSIDRALFDAILEILPKGKTMLELGSGFATGELVKHYTVYSVEHDEKFLDVHHDNYIHAPLVHHKEVKGYTDNLWYDREVLRKEIPKLDYDLLLVDGPQYHRVGFLKSLGFFDLTVPLIFDDVDRTQLGDMRILVAVASHLQKPYIVYGAGEGNKMFGIINDPRLNYG